MQDLVGKTVKDRYRVEQLIGRGGMAEVYKVWDKDRADLLAMKVLREDLAQDKVFLRRFEREAQTLAKLQHRSIVRFYGLEQDDVLVFLLLEYIEGSSLREEIFRCRKPFSVQQTLEMLRPVCAAMHYAHQLGIVHCDLKPGNILIDSHGEYLVTDFGVARMVDASTSTMVGIGTPAYMAPELIKGQDPTPQTDIYALGVILYEMLAGGERPFTGERAETTGSTAEKIRWEQVKLEPKPLPEFNPALPAAAGQVVLRCLAKLPAQRYADIQEVYAELQSLAGKEGVPIQRPKQKEKGSEERLPRVSNDSPRPMQGIESSAEVLSSHRQIIKKTKDQPRSGNSPFIVHMRTQMGDFHDFDLYRNELVLSDGSKLVVQEIQTGKTLQSFGEFENCGQVKFHSGDEQIIFRWQDDLAIVNTRENQIVGDLKNSLGFSITKLGFSITKFSTFQGNHFCVGLDDIGNILAWDLRSRKITGTYENFLDPAVDVLVSPIGRAIKVSDSGFVHQLTLPELKIISRIENGNILTGSNAFRISSSISGELVILSDDKPSLRIYSFKATQIEQKSIFPGHLTHNVVFSPNEQFLLSIDIFGNFLVWNLKTFAEIEKFISGIVEIDKALLSEGGRYLVTLCKDQRLDVWQCNWDALPGVREG